MKHDIKDVLIIVDELYQLCSELRAAYLKQHPDAQLTQKEIERKKMLAFLKAHKP